MFSSESRTKETRDTCSSRAREGNGLRCSGRVCKEVGGGRERERGRARERTKIERGEGRTSGSNRDYPQRGHNQSHEQMTPQEG